MSAAHDAKILEILNLNPGLRFGVPDGFYGNRPIYIVDGPGQADRIAAKAWLMDPEGFAGNASDFATNGWNITAAPTDPSVFGQPWLLPASTGPGNSPNDIVASWGYADNGAMVWYDVRRDGKVTPYASGTGLPPGWALAQSPYTAADFDLTRSQVGATTTTTTTSTTTPPQQTTPVVVPTVTGGAVTPAGTPITGNASDRYLVNGTLYDGLGHVLSVTPTTGTPSAGRALPWVLGVGALYAVSRTFSRR